jgi:hypothetical protein
VDDYCQIASLLEKILRKSFKPQLQEIKPSSGVDFLYLEVVERHLPLESTEFYKKLGAKVMKKELNYLASKSWEKAGR